jgi:hypothetical protein
MTPIESARSGREWPGLGDKRRMPRLSAFSAFEWHSQESQEKLAGDSKGGFLDFWDAIESYNLTFSACGSL